MSARPGVLPGITHRSAGGTASERIPRRDVTPRAYRWGLVGCYGVHLTICLLLLVVLVPHGIHRLSALVVTYGGDQVRYRYQALSLSRGHLPRSPYPIGTGLLLVPLVFTLRKLTPAALGTEVVMVWGVLGFALGLVAVSAIARRVFKRNRVALVAAFLWCVAPLGTYVAVRFAHGASFAYGTAAPTAWLQILSDGPETLCALAAILAYGKARESPRPAWAALAGALGGFAILLRYTGALLFVVVVVAFAFERPSRRAVVAGVSGLLVVLPQLVINRLQLGSPLRTGYQAGSIASTNRFSFAFIGHGVGHLAGQVGWLLLPIGVLAAAVGLVGVADLLRRRMALTSLLVGWLGALVALQAVFEGTWEGGWPRYLMPVYAVLALVAAAALERGVAWCRRWLPDRHSEHRRSSSLQESGPPL